MITEIGIVAGEIWHYLDHHQRQARLEEIIRSIDKSREVILMSIGWLAREGHVILWGEGPDYLVKLRAGENSLST